MPFRHVMGKNNDFRNLRFLHYILLSTLGIVVALGVSVFQNTPGYMDADYYYSGGVRLAGGYGFSDEVIWNYLDDPDGLPHPSHGYWMPLVSMLASGGMSLAGRVDFDAAQLPFLLLSALLPPMTVALALSIGMSREQAFMSGILAVFGGFYVSYLPTTDSFGLYMLFGSSFFILLGEPWRNKTTIRARIADLLIGILAGLMHLTRADGLFWLAVGLLYITLVWIKSRAWKYMLISYGLCVAGYLLVMGPWMARNLYAFGVLLSPAGSQVLWFTEYNDLFYYPADQITSTFFWNHGLSNILRDRLWALGLNLQTAVVVQGEILLAPLIVLGIWQLRNDRRIRIGVFAWLTTFGIMTLVFPFAGARGGFFHSGAALQPLWWSLAPLGLDSIVSWGARVRGWKHGQAQRVFRFGVIVLVVILSIFLVVTRVIGPDLSHPTWGVNNERYLHLERALVRFGAAPDDRVIVNNAPGYYVANQRSALSIPNGDVETVLAVADRYRARYLLLEFNQLKGDDDLFANPGDRAGFKYLGTIDEVRIYEIQK
ncbi:hypothetical protein ACFLZW_06980 [Chloroflexota bacterium]